MLQRFRDFWTKVVSGPADLLLKVGVTADQVTFVGTLGVVFGALWFFPRGEDDAERADERHLVSRDPDFQQQVGRSGDDLGPEVTEALQHQASASHAFASSARVSSSS